jgi:hypothetical protein
MLDLSGTGLNGKEITLIAEGLQHNKTIKFFFARACKIREQGVEKLFAMFSRIFIGVWVANWLRRGLFQEWMPSERCFWKMRISPSLILGGTSAVQLAQQHYSGTDNDFRPSINLSWQTYMFRRAISQLEGRGSLATLDFSWNRLGDIGCSALGEALRCNAKLVRIDISHCGITSTAASALANGLSADGPAAKAGALRILRADCNPMGDVGRDAMVQAAQRRTMLKYSLRTGSSFTDPLQLLASSQVICISCIVKFRFIPWPSIYVQTFKHGGLARYVYCFRFYAFT